MDKFDQQKLVFENRKNTVFHINDRGYLINNGDFLHYSTFIQSFPISSWLNITSKVVLLSFDGKRTLEEVYNFSFNIFKNVKLDKYLADFMDIVNMLERKTIIASEAEINRNKKLVLHRNRVFKKNLEKIKNR